ncbi:MAG: zinc-ribbon domain-containing protein [Eubacteriales bacterium]|nr:zinc-ribbon domain-containing protein [Eubacteriales bacterium]
MMRTCPSCHTEITENDARFCPNCGAPLASSQNTFPGNDAFSQSGNSFDRQQSGRTSGQPFGQPTGQSQGGYTPWGQQPYQGQPQYIRPEPVPQTSSGLAIGALICAFLFTILGLILGCMGLSRYPQGNSNRTMCVVAIVISSLRIAFYVITLLLTIAGVIGSTAYAF